MVVGGMDHQSTQGEDEYRHMVYSTEDEYRHSGV